MQHYRACPPIKEATTARLTAPPSSSFRWLNGRTWTQPAQCCSQGSTKSLAALALLADKLKSHGQILTKIMYILSRLCTETTGVLDSIVST